MEQQHDTKTFVNPTGYWSYEGTYVITLASDTPMDFIPDNVIVEGDMATVTEGSIKQSIGGIDFNSNGKIFSLGYRIKNIRTGTGKLIWVNSKHR